MPWTVEVFSTMVSQVGYDEETKEMTVVWKRGKRSIYSGVPEGLAIEASKAPSVGQFMNTEIKPYYPHRYG